MNTPATAIAVMKEIEGKNAPDVIDLDIVKKMAIDNYNAAHPRQYREGEMTDGEFMYMKNVMFMKDLLNSTDAYKKCQGFSAFKAFANISYYGWSADHEDGDIYLIPRAGKLCISKQANVYLKRLLQTGQIQWAGSPTIVYEGDIYTCINGIVHHEEKNASERIVGGYMKFITGTGQDFYVRFKMSDFQSWRLKSDQPDGGNWNWQKSGQPYPGFLRKKIALHACKSPCWYNAKVPIQAQIFDDVYADDGIDIDQETGEVTKSAPAPQAQQQPAAAPQQQALPPAPVNNKVPTFNQPQQEPAAKPAFLKPKEQSFAF